MENYGLIIRHLRTLAELSVREAAQKIGRSTGWLSEIENNTGTARLSDTEFNRIVTTLDGDGHRPMFKTWAATLKNSERGDRTFDGAVLKFVRTKKNLALVRAAGLSGVSIGHLSNLETGKRPVSVEMRNRLMTAYGYNPSSFKNLSTDPIRSKAVPLSYKLQILLSDLSESQVATAFELIKTLLNGSEIETEK